MIDLSGVSKCYGVGDNRTFVLKEIDLIIEEGDFVAVMGPSGSGKTTLMNLIGCLDQVSSGDYYFDGENINDLDDKSLTKFRNSSIGFVFQQFHLLPKLNALKNTELPLIYSGLGKKERIRRATEALEKVSLSNKLYSLPNELSGGQKQRVAIARAIVNKPKIILADEPTGALDSITGNSIMNQFKSLNQEGTTIIIVTHDIEIGNQCNKIITVRDGLLQQER